MLNRPLKSFSHPLDDYNLVHATHYINASCVDVCVVCVCAVVCVCFVVCVHVCACGVYMCV